jgi:hypothetical protein
MPGSTSTILFVAFIVGGIATSYFVYRSRHRRDLREYLLPDLSKCGVELVASVYPGIFKVGPFPKFEVAFGRPQSRVGGIRGEYTEYRIVTVSDSQGRVHRLWAAVEFELFEFRRVRWRAEAGNSLPPSIQSILET